MKKLIFLVVIGLFSFCGAYSQCSIHPVTLTHQGDVAFPLPRQCMSAVHDAGRPYLYVAGKERGLLVYDVSSITSPVLVDSVKVSDMNNMELMSLSQSGNYLYLALGNVFVNSSKPGMAIVDVTNPAAVVLKSVWQYPIQSGGAGIVKAEGNYAYLGAMRRGLIILDISNKSLPVLMSVFKPSILYPNPTSPDSFKYNARGMAVMNSIVYLCDDAGGIRVINAANKSLPVETGHYSNPAIYNRPRAYNNVVLDDTLLYVATDYCGMEVISVADTSHLYQVGWWNPWHCELPSNTWFNSPGHTNEIQYDPVCKDVFMSSGKSEVSVVNVTNPSSPDFCTGYTTAGGNVGVWGLSVYQGQLFACYLYVPLGIPFFSNWSGFKAITWNSCPAGVAEPGALNPDVTVYPNPAGDEMYVRLAEVVKEDVMITMFNVAGLKMFETSIDPKGRKDIAIKVGGMPGGCYYIVVKNNSVNFYKRIIVGHFGE